jgi:hypothetical protein
MVDIESRKRAVREQLRQGRLDIFAADEAVREAEKYFMALPEDAPKDGPKQIIEGLDHWEMYGYLVRLMAVVLFGTAKSGRPASQWPKHKLEWLGWAREEIKGLTDEEFATGLIDISPKLQQALPEGDGAVEAVLRQLPKAKRAWAKYVKEAEKFGLHRGPDTPSQKAEFEQRFAKLGSRK